MEDEFSVSYNAFMLINMYCLKQNNVNNMKTYDENTLKLCFTQICNETQNFQSLPSSEMQISYTQYM